MIQKSEQQDIDRKGRRLLREALEPLGCVLTSIEEDYGIDYDVQVFVKGSPNGLWFKIQLKSSSSSNYSTDGTFISLQMNLDHIKHYALEIRDPVFLIHADIQSKTVYWFAPQLDNELVRKLTSGKNSSVVTVRVQTSNVLPDSAEQLLKTVERLYVVLGHRTLAISSISSFADSLKYQPDEERLREAVQLKTDFLRFRKIQELFTKRQYNEARSRAQHVVSDPDVSIENKFWAQESLGFINWAEAVSQNQTQSELPLIYIENAKTLQAMSRRGPSHLKLYALIAKKAAELDSLAIRNWGLTILVLQHRTAAGNRLMELSASAAHALSTSQVISKYNQCLRLANYASHFKGRWFLSRALSKIPMAAASFISRIGRMEEAEMGEVGTQFQSSILQIGKLIAWIGEESGDEEAIGIGINSALMSVSSIETDAFKWATQSLDRISDSAIKANVIRNIERTMMRWRGEVPDGDYNPDPYQQLLENAATALGLDISDQNSQLCRSLQIAARDNSPERVLRTCEHIVTSLGATGPTARQITALFGNQMASSKIIHCVLHDYHYEDKDFDSAMATFKSKYCDSCPDRSPRPSEWQFTDAIRRASEAKHGQFIREFNARGTGYRFTPSD